MRSNKSRPTVLRCVNDDSITTYEPSMVRLRCKDVFDLLREEVRAEKNWLSDFEDDPIELSDDVYRILLALREMRSRKVA